jgi:hypothetical protein
MAGEVLHSAKMTAEVNRRKSLIALIAAIAAVGLVVVHAPKSERPPPSISVEVLGYTNRVGPYALLAITNRSESPIKLNVSCEVQYARPVQKSEKHSVDSIEPFSFRVTKLGPHEGFVQEVFVFPAGKNGEWQFICEIAYSSRWLEFKRSAENWLNNSVHQQVFSPKPETWRRIESEWLPCPP